MRPHQLVTALAVAVALSACSSRGGSSDGDRAGDLPRVPSSARAPSSSAAPSAGEDSAPSAGPLRLAKVLSGLDQPVYVTAPAGDERLFVVEQGGLIRVVRDGKALPRPFLDLRAQTEAEGERGLLSMAFSPEYAEDGRLYVDYTDNRGDSQIVEYRVSAADPDRADPATRRVVLSVDQPYANHNGGLLLFDPAGMLLVGLGDGGSSGDPQNNAQDLSSLLGKVLRIDPRRGSPYAIPSDNPFRSRAGARPEIWLSGLRNPWRFSIDPSGRQLWIGDVGQNQVEEVDALPLADAPGKDFGWRVREGDRAYSPGRLDPGRLVESVAVYDHDNGRCSVTGGVVVGARYVYGDYCSGEVWTLRADPLLPGRSVRAGFSVPQLVSFGYDGAGRAYAVSAGGTIWRVVSG